MNAANASLHANEYPSDPEDAADGAVMNALAFVRQAFHAASSAPLAKPVRRRRAFQCSESPHRRSIA